MTMEGVKQTGNEADDEFTIKPQASTPQLDTSNWPLLLKNYDKRKSPLSSIGAGRVGRQFC